MMMVCDSEQSSHGCQAEPTQKQQNQKLYFFTRAGVAVITAADSIQEVFLFMKWRKKEIFSRGSALILPICFGDIPIIRQQQFYDIPRFLIPI